MPSAEITTTFPLLTKTKSARRTFLKQITSAALVGLIPFPGCRNNPSLPAGRQPEILSALEWENLVAVQDILLPSEENIPGARELNAAGYVQWVIGDTNPDPADTRFLKNGLTWIEEEAQKSMGSSFAKLSTQNQNDLLQEISALNWGERWLSMMLLYLFEALFSDPVYGANPDGSGWKWLNYFPGQPRPTEKNKYKSS